MKEKKKYNKQLLFVLGIIIFFIIFTYMPKIIRLFSQPTQNFTVMVGKISDDEYTDALIVRKEEVLTDGSKRIEKDKKEGDKVAKDERIGRFYADNEKDIIANIEKVDKEIEEALLDNNEKINSTENIILDKKIEALISEISSLNSQEKIIEITKEVNDEILKKAKLSGELSKEGSRIKKLLDKKTELENTLNSNTNIITANKAGTVSYRIDGYEDKFNTDDFSTLNKETIQAVDSKAGDIISPVENNVKLVDSFKSYLVFVLKSEDSKKKEVGDSVRIRVSGYDEIPADIVYIADISEEERIMVFEVSKLYDVLSQYRKVNVSIIWWSEEGLKINNDALVKNDNGLTFAKKDRGGYSEIVPVKVIRKTDEYSLIESYKKAEYESAGIMMDYAPSIVEYDEIAIKPKIEKEEMAKFSGLTNIEEEEN